MTKINVTGHEWDVESVDGNTVTLVGGEQIGVNDETLAKVKAALDGPIPKLVRKLSKKD